MVILTLYLSSANGGNVVVIACRTIVEVCVNEDARKLAFLLCCGNSVMYFLLLWTMFIQISVGLSFPAFKFVMSSLNFPPLTLKLLV